MVNVVNFAYIRVSSTDQDFESQRHAILDFCDKHQIYPINFIKDSISGKTPWRERGIGKIVKEAKDGDRLIVFEISRLSRRMFDVLEIVKICLEKKIEVYCVKDCLQFDESLQSTIVLTVLSLCAEIERNLISARTKEALAARKQKGLPLGRPPCTYSSKLDGYATEIIEYKKKGLSNAAIAKLIDKPASTVGWWINLAKKRGLL